MTTRHEAAEVRRLRAQLAALPRAARCQPRCKGWEIFNGDTIQACDECQRARKDLGLASLSDDDVAQLPEAQRARTRELRLLPAWPTRKTPHGLDPCPTCGSFLADREAARLRAEE
jgi:hypothetical protein